MVKIKVLVEFEEPVWRKLPSYQKFAKKLTYEQGCELNTVLWDYWQEILEALNPEQVKNIKSFSAEKASLEGKQ